MQPPDFERGSMTVRRLVGLGGIVLSISLLLTIAIYTHNLQPNTLTKINKLVDSQRIYCPGFSLGGGMAFRVACMLSKKIAAIGTVAGAFDHVLGGCQPSRPVPGLEIHGQADQFAPYAGNPNMGMAAVQVDLD